MGLTSGSTGKRAVDSGFVIERGAGERVIALAGNPNVGKSTVFNELTGLNQHTGNWPGKTVTNAQGRYTHKGREYIMVDIPGTYSLMAHSVEEEVARDFICFGDPDAVVVVCDATCLERNMNLVLQTLEITDRVVVCVNLMDEARKKHIEIDFGKLSENLGVPVVGASARSPAAHSAGARRLGPALGSGAPPSDSTVSRLNTRASPSAQRARNSAPNSARTSPAAKAAAFSCVGARSPPIQMNTPIPLFPAFIVTQNGSSGKHGAENAAKSRPLACIFFRKLI